MKCIIAGSRDLGGLPNDQDDHTIAVRKQNIRESIMRYLTLRHQRISFSEVVSGTAYGIDRLGEDWANSQGIEIKPFPADWKRYGRAAGPVRNREMARYADAAIVFIKDNSSGSLNMVQNMLELRKPVLVLSFMGLVYQGRDAFPDIEFWRGLAKNGKSI